MDLLPEEEIKPMSGFNFAPMIDFLFLMLALFATLAISRATLFDTDVNLVQLKPDKEANLYQNQNQSHNVNISIAKNGTYKWMTDLDSYKMDNIEKVQKEMIRQYDIGLLPKDKSQTEVLLHIDKEAPWDPIAKLIFAVKEIGFQSHPIYEPEN